MAIPAFLANKFAPLDLSSIDGYPNHVPVFHEWNTSFPRFDGNTARSLTNISKNFMNEWNNRAFSLKAYK